MDLCECSSACALCHDTLRIVRHGVGALPLQRGWHGWQSGRPWAWKLGKGNGGKGIGHGGVEENLQKEEDGKPL